MLFLYETDERTVRDGVDSDDDDETDGSDESFKPHESDSEESGNSKRKTDVGSSGKKKIIKAQSKVLKQKSEKRKGKEPKEKKEKNFLAPYLTANLESPICQDTCVMYTSGQRKRLERFCPNATTGSESLQQNRQRKKTIILDVVVQLINVSRLFSV